MVEAALENSSNWQLQGYQPQKITLPHYPNRLPLAYQLLRLAVLVAFIVAGQPANILISHDQQRGGLVDVIAYITAQRCRRGMASAPVNTITSPANGPSGFPARVTVELVLLIGR